MSVYVKTKDGKLKPIREDVTSEEIKNALGYTPADANAVPDVDLSDVEDSDEVFYVTDKNGYIIFRIDKDGIHTTTVNAKEISLGSSLLLKEHLEDAQKTENSKHHVTEADRKKWDDNTAGNAEDILQTKERLESHIGDDNRHKTEEEQAAIDASDEGKTFAIVDKDGYKIAEFDADGLHVHNVLIGNNAAGEEQKSVAQLIEEAMGDVDVSAVLEGYYKKTETYSSAEVDTKLSSKQDTLSFDGTYNKDTNKAATEQTVIDKVAEIVAGAPEDFNTLKEMSTWIAEHTDSAATMNAAINQNTADIEAMKEEIVSGQEEFHIVDKEGNIVATIDENGLHTVEVYLNGEAISSKLSTTGFTAYTSVADLDGVGYVGIELTKGKTYAISYLDSTMILNVVRTTVQQKSSATTSGTYCVYIPNVKQIRLRNADNTDVASFTIYIREL